jgi:hypothetical protein
VRASDQDRVGVEVLALRVAYAMRVAFEGSRRMATHEIRQALPVPALVNAQRMRHQNRYWCSADQHVPVQPRSARMDRAAAFEHDDRTVLVQQELRERIR